MINDEPLLCKNVPGRLWREHSPRAFLTSCTGCLRYPKNWQDTIGGWSPGQSQGYVRTARRRIEIMQSKVASRLRAGGSTFFGERELEEDLLERLRQRQFPRRNSAGARQKVCQSHEVHHRLTTRKRRTKKKRWKSEDMGESSEGGRSRERGRGAGGKRRRRTGTGWTELGGHWQRTSCTERQVRKNYPVESWSNWQAFSGRRFKRSRKESKKEVFLAEKRGVSKKLKNFLSSSARVKSESSPLVQNFLSSPAHPKFKSQPASPKNT